MFPHFKNRRRGVSIENVALGLVIVLIFAGLLYGAFNIVSMKNQARYWQNFSAQSALAIKEYYGLHGRSAAVDFFGEPGNGSIINTSSYLYDSGAIPEPIFEFPSYLPVLPGGGVIQARVTAESPMATGSIPGFDNFGMTFQWADNSRQAQKLCGAISGGAGLVRSMADLNNFAGNPEAIKEAMVESGPLGSNYIILTNSCDGTMLGVPVLQIAYFVN